MTYESSRLLELRRHVDMDHVYRQYEIMKKDCEIYNQSCKGVNGNNVKRTTDR